MHEERVIPWQEPAICIHESTLSQPRAQQAHVELGGRDPIQNAPDLNMIGFATILDYLADQEINWMAAQLLVRHAMNFTARAVGLGIAESAPEAIAATPGSFTGDFLRPVLGLPAMAAD